MCYPVLEGKGVNLSRGRSFLVIGCLVYVFLRFLVYVVLRATPCSVIEGYTLVLIFLFILFFSICFE